MTIHSYEDMGRFNTYILLPMSFLCGTFFATDKLPLAAKYFVELLPLTHTSYLLRNIGAGRDFSLLSAFALGLYMCLFLLLCIWAMRKIKE